MCRQITPIKPQNETHVEDIKMFKGGWYWVGDYDEFGRVVKDMLEPTLGRFSSNQGEVGKENG